MKINDAGTKIVLKSPSAWWGSTNSRIDTPISAVLVIKDQDTSNELFRLSFSVTISSSDVALSETNPEEDCANTSFIINSLSDMRLVVGLGSVTQTIDIQDSVSQ